MEGNTRVKRKIRVVRKEEIIGQVVSAPMSKMTYKFEISGVFCA